MKTKRRFREKHYEAISAEYVFLKRENQVLKSENQDLLNRIATVCKQWQEAFRELEHLKTKECVRRPSLRQFH